MAEIPIIPETITVHLGAPDEDAENITIPFPEYIKNVASNEIYPTWPEAAIRANIYAQISVALNRIYTEWYRCRGYDFDITNQTAFDQTYVKDGNVFANISQIVDEIFNSYLRRPGSVEPLFATYCDGIQTQCAGMSQWGSKDLAEQGLSAYDILTRYYGNNLEIVTNVPVDIVGPTFFGELLRLGSNSNEVKDAKIRLNRISVNYPLIPKIAIVDDIMRQNTVDAVKEFQRIFLLPVTGVIDEATWYKIGYVYSAVKKLAELRSEGINLEEIEVPFEDLETPGQTGVSVLWAQFLLAVIGNFIDAVEIPDRTGVLDEKTISSIRSFQRYRGLPETGVIKKEDLRPLNETYFEVYLNQGGLEIGLPPIFGSTVLSPRMSGERIIELQKYLNVIAEQYEEVPEVPVTGYFGEATENAVKKLQEVLGGRQTGVVSRYLWEIIVSASDDARANTLVNVGQYPGYEIRQQEDIKIIP